VNSSDFCYTNSVMKNYINKIQFIILALLLVSCSNQNKEKTNEPITPESVLKKIKQIDTVDNNKTGEEEAKPSKPPVANKIIYIVIDAQRADRLGCYGFDKPVSPAIDSFAKESVLFKNVHSASPWTLPSFGTLFTGVSPTIHGAGEMLVRGGSKGESIHGVTVGGIRKDLPVMTELLPGTMKKMAYINNSFVNPDLGFARGFDEFDFKIARLTNYRTADEVTDKGIEWIDSVGDDSFFMVLHYFDPHIQYGPPKKYVDMFTSSRPGRVGYPFTNHDKAREEGDYFNNSEWDYIRALYYGETRFVDDEFKRLTEHLKKSGRYDDSWIVIVSDHGEEHYDHGSFEHGHRYEEEVVRVPLIIRSPGGKWMPGSVVEQNVSHIDVLPTILDLADRKIPAHFEGESLVPAILGRPKKSVASYMEYNLFNGQQCAYFDGRYKLIFDVRRNRMFMYDLKEDPKELTKLDKSHPEYARMKETIYAHRQKLEDMAKGKVKNSATLSPETEDALKSLGYVK